jgi:hypothetical protein
MSKSRITHNELRIKLTEGIIKFFFEKKDGELRPAYGTTNIEDIPFEHRPSGVGTRANRITPFFDIQKQRWRSVSETSQVWEG